jgi:poly-beta-hydroxybutyrate-responsive repressor
MGECDPRNFLQPCLLLLLRERSDHGYDLVNRLRELHLGEGEAGAVYRALRGLERQGLVRSTWQTSEAGPARRTYQITASGLADLDRQAVLLEATHRTLHVFRGRYERLRAHDASASDNCHTPPLDEPPPPHDGYAPSSNGVSLAHMQEASGHAAHHHPGHGRADERGVRPPLGTGERAGG